MCRRPGAHRGIQIIQNIVAMVGCDIQHRVRQAIRRARNGDSQSLSREAQVDQRFALSQRIILAITITIRGNGPIVYPPIMRRIFFRLDRGIPCLINLPNLPPYRRVQGKDGRFAFPFQALAGIAATEGSKPRWSRSQVGAGIGA